MKGIRKGTSTILTGLLGTTVLAVSVQAGTFDGGLPEAWVCEGSCGTAVEDGVVQLAPAGGAQYGWVATTGSPLQSLGLPGIGGTNGSRLRSAPFAAEAGEWLEFQFNYVTSDGAGFADYAWARLLDASLEPVALLFTARTRSSGNIVPGFGMPDIAAEVDPETVNIIGGGPRWSPLGGDSGRCFAGGCGYTDWVDSRYAIPATGQYVLEFGVVNWSDTLYQSGLAFDGLLVGGKPIGAESDYQDVRITARIANGNLRLESDGFATEPSLMEERNGRQEVEWRFDELAIGQVRTLDFDLTVLDPRPGESRPLVEQIEIRYRDRLGEEHVSLLGPLEVQVRNSVFDLVVGTDRQIYFPGDAAMVTLDVTNRGSLTNTPVIDWEIRDAAGHRVLGFPAIESLPFAAGEARSFIEEAAAVAGLYAGEYHVVASLADPLTASRAEAKAAFRMEVPLDSGIAATLRVDRAEYDAHQTVELTARLENTASNLQVTDHEVRLTVLDPQGSEIWQQSLQPGALAPGGLQELVQMVPLGAADAGDYRVLMVVLDASGTVVALAETVFTVRSTDATGAGVSGTLAIVPSVVLRSEQMTLEATVTNSGNAGIADLPLSLMLLDPAAEQVLGEWTEHLSLDRDATASLSAVWNVAVPAGSVLTGLLRAEFEGEYRNLASATIRVQDKFVSDPLLQGRGRLLVLLDPVSEAECIDVQGLRLQLPAVAPLADGEQLQVDLYDGQGRLLDSEIAHGGGVLPVDGVRGNGANLILDSGPLGMPAIGLELDGANEDAGSYRLLASLYRDGYLIQFDTAPFAASCSELPATGTDLGDFHLVDVSVHAAGPGTQRRKFLEALLERAGWSYRIVDNAPAFADALRRDGYASFLLLSNRIKLENQVALELREAVFAGRGIVKAGAEDHRNHHLLEVFGADLLGVQPHAEGLRASPSAPFPVPEPRFAAPARAVEVRLNGGDGIAEYHGDRGQRLDIAAVSTHRYGLGSSLLAGFDILAQAEAEGISGAFAGFLTEALAYTHPDPALLRPGLSVPVRWRLTNRGAATSVELQLEMAGGRVMDPGHGTLLGPSLLAYVLDMPAESQREQTFWWQLPWASEPLRVTASLDLEAGFHSELYGVSTHDFVLERLPDFADLEQQVAARLGDHQRYRQVLDALQKAASRHDRGDTVDALAHLLKAADWLSSIPGPEAKEIRVSLAWLIHRLGLETGAG